MGKVICPDCSEECENVSEYEIHWQQVHAPRLRELAEKLVMYAMGKIEHDEAMDNYTEEEILAASNMIKEAGQALHYKYLAGGEK